MVYVPAEGSALVSLNLFRHLLLAVKASWTGSIINPKSSYADAVQKSEKKKIPLKPITSSLDQSQAGSGDYR